MYIARAPSGLVSPGGMPSSHSSLVTGLATAVAREEGLGSPLFAAAAVFASIVMYDAAGVRQAVSVQAGARGYALTGEERYLEPYHTAMLGLQQTMPRLTQLVADNPRQQARVARLSSLLNEELAIMKDRLAARQRGGLPAASAVAADGRGKKTMDAVRGVIRGMEDEERQLLDDYRDELLEHSPYAERA